MSTFVVALILTFTSVRVSSPCETPFEGFGVYVGTPTHMNSTNMTFVQTVLDLMYFDLEIRHYRINYLPYFSPTPNEYTISCSSPDCEWAWEGVLEALSNTTKYPNITLISSIWTAPYYMKNNLTNQLLPHFQDDFYYFIKNITHLIQQKYGLQVERVSPVNEPDNVFATWDHTVMTPDQLCSMVIKFNDPLTSVCPEASHFWITDFYMHYTNVVGGFSCYTACQTVLTHAYLLNLKPGTPNFGLAYYDPFPHRPAWGNRRRWMTEVCSTYGDAATTQVTEGLDLARNIINFVGTTCVERYYFWYAYMDFPSGEAILWGGQGQTLIYPKKYYVYKHFTKASSTAGKNATAVSCNGTGLVATPGNCLVFEPKNSNTKVIVFLNRESTNLPITPNCSNHFCCTTPDYDYKCDWEITNVLPPQSVCACTISS